jgi:hypothetical protein
MGLVSRVIEAPRTVAEAVADTDHDALGALTHRLRDDAAPETRERRERPAFADLWAAFDRD